MTIERKKQIQAEAKKRVKLWLSKVSFDEMTVKGSHIWFNMRVGLLGGYPFKKESWMAEEDFNAFITEEEFDSEEYSSIMGELYYKSMHNDL